MTVDGTNDDTSPGTSDATSADVERIDRSNGARLLLVLPAMNDSGSTLLQ